MTPIRGEVWLFDLGMAEKVRPALVIQRGLRRCGPRVGHHCSSHDQPSRISIRDSSQCPIFETRRVSRTRRVNVSACESDPKTGCAQAGPVRLGVCRCPAMAWSGSPLRAIDRARRNDLRRRPSPAVAVSGGIKRFRLSRLRTGREIVPSYRDFRYHERVPRLQAQIGIGSMPSSPETGEIRAN